MMQTLLFKITMVIAAIDLNVILYMEIKDLNVVTLITQQQVLKESIATIKYHQEHMQSQLARINGILKDKQIKRAKHLHLRLRLVDKNKILRIP